MIDITTVHWLAVLVSFVVNAALAGVYFTVLVARPYAVALGREHAPKPPRSVARDVGPIVCVLATTVTSALLLQAVGVTSVGPAVVFGLVVGVGYLTAMTFQIALNPNFPRPLLYGVVNAPYFLITSVLTAVIVTLIR